jgi:hypothetical protein
LRIGNTGDWILAGGASRRGRRVDLDRLGAWNWMAQLAKTNQTDPLKDQIHTIFRLHALR